MTDLVEVPVDQVLYINLDERLDRQAHMEAILANCPWPSERLSATRFASHEDAGQDEGSLSVLSIWDSHRRALLRGLQLVGDGALVVLEDDVRINPHFFEKPFAVRASLQAKWDVILLSPRYRPRSKLVDGVRVKQPWVRKPFGHTPTRLATARKEYIVNGAHFCVYRNAAAIRRVINKMDEAPRKYDFDAFCGIELNSFGIHHDHVGTANLGSDHLPTEPS